MQQCKGSRSGLTRRQDSSGSKNDMDTLQNMRVFVRVVEAGSFTAAAQHLNTTTAYASRAVSDLEAHLRTRLLNRTTRRIALTEAGERYLQRCEQILAYVDQAEAEASDAHARPAGRLKVHSMTSFGQHYVVPMISRYQERHPSVQVDLTLAQRMPDLLDEGYDVSLVLASGCRTPASFRRGSARCSASRARRRRISKSTARRTPWPIWRTTPVCI